jgi:[Skp1-protein]-hydroxyproline N-acetylglucosaminyltransferase
MKKGKKKISSRGISQIFLLRTCNNQKNITFAITLAVTIILLVALVTFIVIILVRRQYFRFNKTIVLDEKLRENLIKKYIDKDQLTRPTILVSISSYRDPELCITLEDLYDKALFPDRIHVGIVEQNDPSDPPTCHATNAKIDKKHLKIKTLHYSQAKGPTYARSLCEKHWSGEDYYLMVDSHMRFEPGWDVELIEMILKTRRPRRSIITMYPEGYERNVNHKTGTIEYMINIRKGWRFEQLKKFNDQGIVEFESVSSMKLPPKTPQHVPMYAACFAFSHSDILKIVPYHPDTPYLFFGNKDFK